MMIKTLRIIVITASLITLGTPVFAQVPTEEVEYYGRDAVGSVRVVFDANGAIVGRMDYAPFGAELRSAQGLPSQRFAELFRDGEAGLDYAQARAYQLRTARFNRPDPVFNALWRPQRWNRYAYAQNRPLSRIDPSGLTDKPLDIGFKVGTEVVGTMPGPIPGQGAAPWGWSGGDAGAVALPDDQGKTPDDEPELGGGDDGVPEKKNACYEFADSLAERAVNASSIVDLAATGVSLMRQSLTPSRWATTDWRSLRPEISRNDQAYGGFAHVTGGAGLAIVGGTTNQIPSALGVLSLRNEYDLFQGGSQGREEAFGNSVGFAVGLIMLEAFETKDRDKAAGEIRKAVCK